MSKKKKDTETSIEASVVEDARIMSRKDYPILLQLKDGKTVKLTKNKTVVIRKDQLPENLPPGILVY